MRGTRLWFLIGLIAALAPVMIAAGCGDDDGDGGEVQSVEDLSGLTVGVQDGTTGETYAKEETDASSVRGYPQGPDAINALRNGQVDAVIIDQPVAIDAVEKQGGVEIVEEIQTNELYGIFFPPDNDPLREKVNEELQAMIDDGTLADLYQQYFNTDPPETVTEGTTKVEDDSGTEDPSETGELLVATDAPFPPFEIGEPPDVSGFDIDVVNDIAERLGVEVTYQNTSFATIFRDVAGGRFDMAVAATTITPGRSKTVDFSNPYYEAQQALVVATE
jgi:ABC-type amino acid transport substrate-binding protein